MVIDNFNVFGTVFSPDEAHPPLVVDANAVLAIPVPFKGVKTIARRQRRSLSSLAESNAASLGSAWFMRHVEIAKS